MHFHLDIQGFQLGKNLRLSVIKVADFLVKMTLIILSDFRNIKTSTSPEQQLAIILFHSFKWNKKRDSTR